MCLTTSERFQQQFPAGLAVSLELSNSAASPQYTDGRFFYAMRLNPDKVQVANTLMDMLKKKRMSPSSAKPLYRMPYRGAPASTGENR
jgi:hypothetical protein